MKAIFWVFLVLFAPIMVLAQVVPPETVDQAVGLLPALLQAIMAGKWTVVVAGLVMILTAVARQYGIPKLKLKEAHLPYVALALSAIAGICAHMFGGVDAKAAAVQILVTGGIASQMWSMLGKTLTAVLLDMFGKELATSPEANK